MEIYPVDRNWSNHKASQKETTRYYHTTRQCIMAWFPYFDVDYVEIPNDATATLCNSHKNYLSGELSLVFGNYEVQTRCRNVRWIQVQRIESWLKALCSTQTFNVLFMLNTPSVKSLLNHFQNLGLFLTHDTKVALSSLQHEDTGMPFVHWAHEDWRRSNYDHLKVILYLKQPNLDLKIIK